MGAWGSLDDLVGAGEEGLRDIFMPSAFAVLRLTINWRTVRRLYRQINGHHARMRSRVRCRLPILVGPIDTVGDQASPPSKERVRVNRKQAMLGCQCDD